jgi:hypothetical protein
MKPASTTLRVQVPNKKKSIDDLEACDDLITTSCGISTTIPSPSASDNIDVDLVAVDRGSCTISSHGGGRLSNRGSLFQRKLAAKIDTHERAQNIDNGGIVHTDTHQHYRRWLIAFAAFSSFLLLGNLGLSMATMSLVVQQQTLTDDQDHLISKRTGNAITTKAEGAGGVIVHLDLHSRGRLLRSAGRSLVSRMALTGNGNSMEIGSITHSDVLNAHNQLTSSSAQVRVEFNDGGLSDRVVSLLVHADYEVSESTDSSKSYSGMYVVDETNKNDGTHHEVSVVCETDALSCSVYFVHETSVEDLRRRLGMETAYGGTSYNPDTEKVIQCYSKNNWENHDKEGGLCKMSYATSTWCPAAGTAGIKRIEYHWMSNLDADGHGCYIVMEKNDKYYCDPGQGQQCVERYSCFSPEAKVLTKGKGEIPMKDLKIGDSVLTASGSFKKVHTFLHRKPDTPFDHSQQPSLFLKISTEGSGIIEISPKHFIHRVGDANPVEASVISPGDYLYFIEAPGSKTTTTKQVKVLRIEPVFYNGAMAPATEDGTIVVGGIVASVYSNPRHAASDFVAFANYPIMHRAHFTHLVTTPHRLFCKHVSDALCQNLDDTKETRIFGESAIVYLLGTGRGEAFVRFLEACIGVLVFLMMPGLAIIHMMYRYRHSSHDGKQKLH